MDSYIVREGTKYVIAKSTVERCCLDCDLKEECDLMYTDVCIGILLFNMEDDECFKIEKYGILEGRSV